MDRERLLEEQIEFLNGSNHPQSSFATIPGIGLTLDRTLKVGVRYDQLHPRRSFVFLKTNQMKVNGWKMKISFEHGSFFFLGTFVHLFWGEEYDKVQRCP